MKNKNLLIIGGIILVLVIICLVLFLCFRTKKVSKLEEMKLRENSRDVISYIYNVTNDDYEDVEKYILYGIDYYKFEKNYNSIPLDDIVKLAKERFNKDITKEQIIGIGMTPEMIERNIFYDFEMDCFNVSNVEMSRKEIADTALFYYKIDSIRKRGNKYFVSYTEYKIETPYEILNYYNDLTEEYRSNSTVFNENGESINVEAPVDAYDVDGIMDYLNGEKGREVLYDYVSDELLEKVGKVNNKIKVTYVIENDKIVVDKVEQK